VAGTAAGVGLFGSGLSLDAVATLATRAVGSISAQSETNPPDYTLRIGAAPVEIAPKHIVSAITYNGHFLGPLLRFKEGQSVTLEVHNDTDTPEQLHWHGQFVSPDVDGAVEEGTPFIPARGVRRIMFTPRPAGFRVYHTHNRAGADLYAGQYSGQVGPVYIEPKHEPGSSGQFLRPAASRLLLSRFLPTNLRKRLV
jgi:FtsP/CotA-like multicopper oxidase with cupredoxin domain